MGISADLIKTLRERTGAGMMDCKKALNEVGGNLEEAADWLRKKGLAAAAKKASRAAAEGLIGVKMKDQIGAIVEVNAETDFVGRNDKFQELVYKVAEIALGLEGDVEKVRSADLESGRSVEQSIGELIAVIGENMTLRRTACLKVKEGIIASYIHNAVAPDLGRIGVLVALESSGDKSKLLELGKQLAMHIAAAHPQALSQAEVDPAVVTRERDILVEQAKALNRPADVIEKMVEGRLRKFYEEVVLLEQAFVMDPQKRISEVIQEFSKQAGAPVQLTGFIRYAVGEGIEKAESNFAAEVAAQLAN